METNNSTSSLVRKARKGNTEAYGELLSMYKDYFYRTAFLYTKSEDLALEVFQEAVVQGLLYIKQIKNPEYFKTWMTRIIYNCAMELFRKLQRARNYSELGANINLVAEQEPGLSKEEKMDLHHAVERLEEPYRTLIVKKYFEEMKISEIAEQSKKPEGTIRSELSRARKQLRIILKEGYQHV